MWQFACTHAFHRVLVSCRPSPSMRTLFVGTSLLDQAQDCSCHAACPAGPGPQYLPGLDTIQIVPFHQYWASMNLEMLGMTDHWPGHSCLQRSRPDVRLEIPAVLIIRLPMFSSSLITHYIEALNTLCAALPCAHFESSGSINSAHVCRAE